MKELKIRLSCLLVTCIIAVGIVTLLNLHSPWGFVTGLVMGGFSQIVALVLYGRQINKQLANSWTKGGKIKT